MVELDGAAGEGGGQILRTALCLSMIHQRPFTIRRIRAGRAKPGLLRQHLTAVQAAAAICGAETSGAAAGSGELVFRPGPLRAAPPEGGRWRFDIQTAGSTGLVFQTVFLPLALAGGATVEILGGTHNGASPPTDFLAETFAPIAARCGFPAAVRLDRHGFYPAGGGAVTMEIGPARPADLSRIGPLDLTGWRPDPALSGVVRASRLGRARMIDAAAALRDALRALRTRSADPADPAVETPHPDMLDVQSQGPGAMLQLRVRGRATAEEPAPVLVLSEAKDRAQPLDACIAALMAQAEAVLTADSLVDEHLADQLLLPMALAGGGSFRTGALSLHTQTNIAVIQQFMAVTVEIHDRDGVNTVHVRV